MVTIFFRKSNRHSWLNIGAAHLYSNEFIRLVYLAQLQSKGWQVGYKKTGNETGHLQTWSLPCNAQVTHCPDITGLANMNQSEAEVVEAMRKALQPQHIARKGLLQ